MRRRIDVQADDVPELGSEGGIPRQIKGLQAVGLQTVGLPDPLHRGARDADRLGHSADRPVGRLTGRRRAGQAQHLVDGLGRQRRNTGWPRLLAQQPCHPLGHESLLPAPDRRLGNASLPGDRHCADPVAAQEDNPGPPDVLLRAARRRDDRFEASTIPSADFDLDIRSHPAILARIAAKGNLSLVTNH